VTASIDRVGKFSACLLYVFIHMSVYFTVAACPKHFCNGKSCCCWCSGLVFSFLFVFCNRVLRRSCALSLFFTQTQHVCITFTYFKMIDLFEIWNLNVFVGEIKEFHYFVCRCVCDEKFVLYNFCLWYSSWA
jgi:hypothetical protein